MNTPIVGLSRSLRRNRFVRIIAAIAAITAYVLATTTAFAVAPLVNASIEPRQISMGDTAQLTITSTGNGMDAVSLPEVAGLEFRVVGQSRRMSIINGATLSTTSVIVRITPRVPGIFTIPGITPQSQPLVLRVNPDNGYGSSGSNGGGYGRSDPTRPQITPGSSGIKMSADGNAFIRMNLPKRDVYVGESIPVDIEVGMRDGIVTSLNGLPTLTGSEFTLNNLSRQPERAQKLVDGQPYTVMTWHSALAPVKPGTFTLSVDSPITLRVRTRPQRDTTIDDLLGDPFMQNFFGTTVAKELTITSPPVDLKVLALPDGRPRDFSGAVGTFKITSELSATTAAAGDPLTLKMHVTGSGNFDRVDTGMLEHVDQWKTYPPKSTFKASDSIGYKGEKIFEQPLIASLPGTHTLPPLTFNYFDPNTRSYETAHAAPLNVTISPALADTALGTQGATGANDPNAHARPDTATNAANAGSNGLRPDHAVTDSSPRSLVPLYLQPRFHVLSSLLALALAGAWIKRRCKGSEGRRNKRALRSSKETARVLKLLQAAATANDARQFFTLARSTLQHALGARWQIAPEAITVSEVAARLSSNGDGLQEIFTLADEVNYAGHPATATDFNRWIQIVREQLAEVKAT